MRILALSNWWPAPADNGIRLRLSSLLHVLAQRHEIHLVAMHGPEPLQPEHYAAAQRICASTASVPLHERPLRRTDQLVSLWRNEPASVRATWNPAFANLVRTRAAEVKPDVTLVFELSIAPYARFVPNAPRVLDDLEMARIFDAFAGERNLRRRVRAWLTWSKHREYVARMLRDFAGYTVVSQHEAQLALALAPSGLPAIVIPNGAVVDDTLGRFGMPERDLLIYPGALSFDANFDAMHYFLNTIFPAIRAACPNVRLQITGKPHPQRQAALPNAAGVEFTGFVEDVRPLVARAWAEVVPLRIGSGTRLKILEALALGTPVVSTRKGAEGLDLRANEDLLIADTPEEFAAATVRLLNEPELRARIGAAGYRAVRERYDWRIIGRQLEDLLHTVTQPTYQRIAS